MVECAHGVRAVGVRFSPPRQASHDTTFSRITVGLGSVVGDIEGDTGAVGSCNTKSGSYTKLAFSPVLMSFLVSFRLSAALFVLKTT